MATVSGKPEPLSNELRLSDLNLDGSPTPAMATVFGKPEPLSDDLGLSDLKLRDKVAGLTNGLADSSEKTDDVHLPGLLSADGGVGLTGTLPEKMEAASGEITSEECLKGNKLLEVGQKVLTAAFAPAHAAPAVPAPVLPLQPTPAVPAPALPLQPAPAPPLQPEPVVEQLNNNPWVRVVRRHRHGQQVNFDDDDDEQVDVDDDDEDEPFIDLEIEEGTPSSEEEDDLERVLWEPKTTSRRAAMKWSQARLTSYVCTKNGPGVFVFGSYGPGFQY